MTLKSSDCQPGQEQYEHFRNAAGRMVVQYDYRTPEGKLFTTVAPTLGEAIKRRDRWLKKNQPQEEERPEYQPTYYVKSVRICEHCKGDRMVTHPAWLALTDTFSAVEFARMSEAAINQWFADQGYALWPNGTIPEEVECPDCEGIGEIIKEVELQEALSILLDRVARLENLVE